MAEPVIRGVTEPDRKQESTDNPGTQSGELLELLFCTTTTPPPARADKPEAVTPAKRQKGRGEGSHAHFATIQ